MAEARKARASTTPATAAERRLAKRIEELQVRCDRIEKALTELVAGNLSNAREAWS